MKTASTMAAALLLLLASSATASPTPFPSITYHTPLGLRPRQTAEPALQPWVTIGDDAKARTITPVRTTTDGGKTTTISEIPYSLTGLVYTLTSYAEVRTSTFTAPPNPTAEATDGARGSFQVCRNADQSGGGSSSPNKAPWCLPREGETLNPDKNYYFTWDALYFGNATNTTLKVQVAYINSTSGDVTETPFTSTLLQASQGWFAYHVPGSLLKDGKATNISLQLAALSSSGQTASTLRGPRLTVDNPPGYTPVSTPAPSGSGLYIGLPVAFGALFLILFGTCLCNYRTRRIGLGNVMSRSRFGKAGKLRLGRSVRRQRKADERIQLMEREVRAEGGEVYRDAPEGSGSAGTASGSRTPPPPQRPRRDSDGLGSLAGTPTEDRRMDFGAGAGGQQTGRDGARQPNGRNAFRDELRRQEEGGMF